MGKWQRSLYQPNLPLGDNGERVTASKEHRELSRKAALEGMVLLKTIISSFPFVKEASLLCLEKAVLIM